MLKTGKYSQAIAGPISKAQAGACVHSPEGVRAAAVKGGNVSLCGHMRKRVRAFSGDSSMRSPAPPTSWQHAASHPICKHGVNACAWLTAHIFTQQ